MQPNTIQFQSPTNSTQPQPTPQIATQANYQVTPTPQGQKKKKHLSLPLAIIFCITTLGLLTYVVIDKITSTESTTTNNNHTIDAPISTPLSQIKIPDSSADDILKNALSGRTFAINPNHDEFISFTSDSKYEFSYYREPNADRKKLQPSTETGTYSVKNNTITLDNDETFQITGDYIVKDSAKISKNQTAVYFDSLQFNKVMPNISVALSNYLNTTKKPEAPNFEKIRIDQIYCHADYSNKNITNADSYICDTSYSALFDETKLATQMSAAKIANFPSYCSLKGSPYSTYVLDGGMCTYDGTISNWSFVIIRTDNISYRVTGTFRNEEGAAEAPQRY